MSGILEERIEIRDDQARAALQRVADEAGKTAAELDKLKAKARLEDLGASGNYIETLILKYRRQREEIERLGKASGDEALTAKAMAATDRELATAIERRNTSTTKAKSATENLSVATGKATKTVGDHVSKTDDMTAATGRAGATVARLGGAIGVLNPQVGAIAGGITEAISAFDAMGVAGGSLMSVVGPVGIAIAGLSLWYKKLAKDAEEAARRQEEAAAAATRMQHASIGVTGKREMANLKLQVASGEVPEIALKSREAQLQAEADYADLIAIATEKQAAAQERLRKANEAQGEGTADADKAATVNIAMAAVEVANREYEALRDQVTNYAATLLETQDVQENSKERSRDYAAAAKDEARASREAADAAKQKEEAERKERIEAERKATSDARREILGDQEKMRAYLEEQIDGLASLQEQGKLTEDQMSDMAQSIEEAMKAGAITGRQAFGLRSYLSGLEASPMTTPSYMTPDRIVSGVQTYGGILSGDQGTALSAIGSAGPIGAIVAAVLGVLTTMGELGAQGVEDRIREFNDNVIAGLEALPEILAEVIPELTGEFVPALIEGLIRAAPEIGNSIATSMYASVRELLTGFWEKLKEVFSNLSLGSVSDFFSGGEGLGGWATIATGGLSDLLPKFDRGSDYVSRTGLAVVHRGETIHPEGGARQGQQGGGTVINIGILGGYGAIDELDRLMREQTGRGLSFGAS